MIIHRANTRGHADHGWLKTFHTFSFANYFNPNRIHFGCLRVLNDDTIEAGQGFPTHPHENMEIVTIPIQGALAHKDSTGTEGVVGPGEVQRMSAGTGIAHSEYNASDSEPVNLLQIWVFPKQSNVEPGYEQKKFESTQRQNRFQVLVSPNREENSLQINQDAVFAQAKIDKNKSVEYQRRLQGNGVYAFVISGSIEVNGERLTERDALGLEDFSKLEFVSQEYSELLVIEVPMQVPKN